MSSIVLRVRTAAALIGIGLVLSSCGYNTIPTLEEQANRRCRSARQGDGDQA
jgi:hypothetical protein